MGWSLSCTMYRCTVYHVLRLRACARSCGAGARRISEATRFWDWKGFGMDPFMYHGPCWNLACYARSCEAKARRISEAAQFCVRKGFEMHHVRCTMYGDSQPPLGCSPCGQKLRFCPNCLTAVGSFVPCSRAVATALHSQEPFERNNAYV